MSFSVHTFETNPEGNLGFAFHHRISEGQNLYFLAKFDTKTTTAEAHAEAIFGAIVDYFDSHPGEEAYNRFENGLKAANKVAQKITPSIISEVDIIVTFFDFHHLYLTQAGRAEAYLLRNGNMSQISEVPEASDDLFLNVLSGQVAIDDILMLASHRILRTMTSKQLCSSFAHPHFGEGVRNFKHDLSSNSEEDILVTVIGIGKKDGISAAGFLSKVIAKKDALLKPNKTTETPLLDTPLDETVTENETILRDTPDPEDAPTKGFKRPSFNYKIPAVKINKNALIIAAVLLGIFSAALFINSINFESEAEAQLREKISIANENLRQADSFLLQGDKDSAKENLARAEKSVQAILSSKSKLFRSDAQFILADIQKKQLQVENAHKAIPKQVADLGAKNENLESIGLLELKSNLYVYDSKKLHKTIRNVVEKALTISENATILAAASRPNQNMILLLTNDPQIVEYKEGLLTPMRTTDENWKKGIDMKTYGRYTYVLDPVENQIWKYERKRANYSGAIPYNEGSDLSRAVSFAIDGAIYIITDEGKLQKIFRGQKQNYTFRELPSQEMAGKNLKIYTTPELDYLYVLDPENERLLIFVKGDQFATYKKQIFYDLPDARDFIIGNSGQKVNLLTKDQIYEFSL